MVFSRNKYIPRLKLLINGNEIEQVKSFQYLWALVTEDGRCEFELNRRIAVAKNNFAKMSRILTDHDMSLATKIRLAQCYVWSKYSRKLAKKEVLEGEKGKKKKRKRKDYGKKISSSENPSL